MRKVLSSIAAMAAIALAPGAVHAAAAQKGSAHDFTFQSIDGKPMPLKGFAGKVLLIVNTASFCGFTRQYEGLQKLWADYEAKGLVVIGVPSNDFGAQEPKAEDEIKEFCQGAFGITFPLTSKESVSGEAAHPFYKWARDTLGTAAAPGWNFHKYLVGGDGRLVSAFSTRTAPDDKKVTAAIEAELARGRAAK